MVVIHHVFDLIAPYIVVAYIRFMHNVAPVLVNDCV